MYYIKLKRILFSGLRVLEPTVPRKTEINEVNTLLEGVCIRLT